MSCDRGGDVREVDSGPVAHGAKVIDLACLETLVRLSM